MPFHGVDPPFLEEFLAAAEAVAQARPEVDLDAAREVFTEAATLLYNGLVLAAKHPAHRPQPRTPSSNRPTSPRRGRREHRLTLGGAAIITDGHALPPNPTKHGSRVLSGYRYHHTSWSGHDLTTM